MTPGTLRWYLASMAESFLSDELHAEIAERLRRGLWHSAEEFVRQSIKASDAFRDLQAAIAEGTSEIACGESTDGEAFFDELEAGLLDDLERESEG